ncbi:MAG TPA: DUF4843 domain-containing protein [Parasegetibacter sp.]
MRSFILYITILISLVACKKDEIKSFLDADPAVYFIHSTSRITSIDSITYTFVEKSSNVTSDTIWLPVRISGDAVDFDRKVNLVADPAGTTAVKDKHYKLLDYFIPKNSFTTQLGVVLLRDASLQSESVVLNLQILPSDDFGTLMKDTLTGDGRFYTKNRIKIIFTDRLLKPDNWDSYLVTFFGPYSDVKFRFIAGELGVSTFPTTGPNAVNFPKMQFYQTVVRNALFEYTQANGPLIDENGNPVVIP